MKKNTGLLLTFDFGLSWIGVAVGQQVTCTATPLAPFRATDGKPNWDAIEQVINEWKPEGFLVGKPLNMDGTDCDMTQRAIKFGNRLHGRFNLPVQWYDERLTSFEAKGLLLNNDRNDRNFKQRNIDSISAVIIFEGWAENQSWIADAATTKSNEQ